MDIRILLTGGTLDKKYDPIGGSLGFGGSQVSDILKFGRCTFAYSLTELMAVDSLEMSSRQRRLIVRECARCHESRIVVVHGTDSMVATAEAIAAAELQKTVVLTGAMVPYSVSGSDAMFNMGAAVVAVQLADRGVYIAVN